MPPMNPLTEFLDRGLDNLAMVRSGFNAAFFLREFFPYSVLTKRHENLTEIMFSLQGDFKYKKLNKKIVTFVRISAKLTRQTQNHNKE